jgi:hypothetical protein
MSFVKFEDKNTKRPQDFWECPNRTKAPPEAGLFDFRTK